MLLLAFACGAPNQSPPPSPEVPADEPPRLASFEDLSPWLGDWRPLDCGVGGFSLERARSTTGYGLVDRTVDPAVPYDITGDRMGPDGVLRMAVREGPTGAVKHLELAFPSANDRITLTWTQPAAPPIELYSPSGASAACP